MSSSYEVLGVFGVFAFAYSIVASRLERTPVNGPLIFLAFGVASGPLGLGILDLDIDREAIRTVAELTLAIVLFSDAANADLRVLGRARQLPIRLLLIGLPLTIGLGVLAGRLLFPELALIEIAILATMLAPTDAALGMAVVQNEQVPAPVRQGLNVESGLNDGICVPILFTFLHLATSVGDEGSPLWLALTLVGEEIGIGLAVGVPLAVVGAYALRASSGRGWIEAPWEGIPVIALALASFALAQFAGGSGFISAFTGGLVFGALTKEHKELVLAGAEGTGQVFSLITWVVFGAVVVGELPGVLDWRVLLYAALSLTVVRMFPVWLSLAGARMTLDAKLFIGWFGPRGLASVVFAVIVTGRDLPGNDLVMATTVAVVVLSIIGHGLSANPLSSVFARAEKARAE